MRLRRRSILALSGGLVVGAAGCVTGGDSDADGGDTGGTAGSGRDTDDTGSTGSDDPDGGGSGDTGSGPGDGRRVEPAWTYDTGGSVATVADGVVYGCEEFVDGTGGVVALDAETGERVWVHGETGGYSSYTTPVVADKVYFGFGDDAIGSGNGHVTAVARDGTEQWVTDTGSVYEPPIPAGDALYVGSDDGRVYCLRADTGEVRWSHEVGENPSGPSVAAVDDGVVYASLAERLVALDATDGRERWIARPGGSDLRRVRVDDRVYAATREQVAAIDGGRLAWTNDRIGRQILAVRDGTVFVSDGVRLAALGADDGEERWHVETADDHVARVGPAAVYLGVEDLLAVDTAGEQRWRTPLDGSDSSPLVVTDGSIYVDTDSRIYRVDTEGGIRSEAEVASVRGLVVGADPERVYAATSDRMVALDM